MENASKALLIAGAVLIVIVLISVGMLIVNQASSVTDQVGDTVTSQTVASFNSNFNNYAGTQRGSSIKTLLQSISSNNATTGSGRKITVTSSNWGALTSGNNDSTAILKESSNIVGSGRYRVEMTSTDNEGYINHITITRIN